MVAFAILVSIPLLLACFITYTKSSDVAKNTAYSLKQSELNLVNENVKHALETIEQDAMNAYFLVSSGDDDIMTLLSQNPFIERAQFEKGDSSNEEGWMADGVDLILFKKVVDTSQETIGTIKIKVSTSKIQALLKKQDQNDTRWTLYNTAGVNVFSSNEKLNAVFLDQMKEQSSGRFQMEIDGIRFFVVFERMNQTGWTTVGYTALNAIVAPLNEAQNQIFFYVLFTILISIVLAFFVSKEFTKSITRLGKEMGKVKKGNLTVRYVSKKRDEIGELTNIFHDMTVNLHGIAGEISGSRERVQTIMETLYEQNADHSENTSKIDDVVDTMNEQLRFQQQEIEKGNVHSQKLTDSIEHVLSKIKEVEKVADNAKDVGRAGGDWIEQMSQQSEDSQQFVDQIFTNIGMLSDSSNQISSITKTIDSITKQISLVSLNASIEAARAGEQGRGFRVVAEEIKKLTEQTQQSSKEITKLVEITMEQIGGVIQGTEPLKDDYQKQIIFRSEVIEVLEQIAYGIEHIKEKMSELTIEAKGMEKDKTHIIDSITNIALAEEKSVQVANEVSELTQNQVESASLITRLIELTVEEMEKLNENITNFKLEEKKP